MGIPPRAWNSRLSLPKSVERESQGERKEKKKNPQKLLSRYRPSIFEKKVRNPLLPPTSPTKDMPLWEKAMQCETSQ